MSAFRATSQRALNSVLPRFLAKPVGEVVFASLPVHILNSIADGNGAPVNGWLPKKDSADAIPSKSGLNPTKNSTRRPSEPPDDAALAPFVAQIATPSPVTSSFHLYIYASDRRLCERPVAVVR